MAKHWVFDLDNTLYPVATGIAEQCDLLIVQFLQQVYGVDKEQARARQLQLRAEHGTTLRGLMTTRGIAAADFLAFEDELDYSPLQPDPRLIAAIGGLPGRRFVFTNGSAAYARRVLGLLGLDTLVDGVWGIDSGGYVPKPWHESYERCFRGLGIEPMGSVFVDDLARNLEVPKRLGMTTVLVDINAPETRSDSTDHEHVDVWTRDIAEWLTCAQEAVDKPPVA